MRPCSVLNFSVHCQVLNHYSITGRPFSTNRPQIILPHGIHTYTDWRPRILLSEDWSPTLLAYSRYIENGTEGSDGRDIIHLTQYSFERNLWHYHYKQIKMNLACPEGQIEDNSRYKDGRCCCVFNESSIMIVREKNGSDKLLKIRSLFETPRGGSK